MPSKSNKTSPKKQVGAKKGAARKAPKSTSAKCSLIFPVGRINTMIKRGRYA